MLMRENAKPLMKPDLRNGKSMKGNPGGGNPNGDGMPSGLKATELSYPGIPKKGAKPWTSGESMDQISNRAKGK